jgi:hypothetical protein
MAAAAPLPETEAERQRKKALRIINTTGEFVASLERSGVDVSSSLRSLDLAKSFLKAGSYAKAIQYAKKADVLARDQRDREKTARENKPKCPGCGVPLEPDWTLCPKCGNKLN